MRMLGALLLVVMASHGGALASVEVKGFNYVCWERDGYFEGDEILDRVAGLGTNALAVLITAYQDTYASDTVYCDSLRTPSDSSIQHVVARARGLGLSALIRLQVDSKDGTWRGYFEPGSRDAWFDSYRNIVLHYAELAEAAGAGGFGIGCEYKSLSGAENRQRWSDLLIGVRERFHGAVTYAANWDEYRSVSFWDLVDQAGIDAYFPLSDAQYPSVNELHHGYFHYRGLFGDHRWMSELRSWFEEVDKPTFLSEVGFANVDFVAREPWRIDPAATRDDLNQANAYEAVFRAFIDESWCSGLFWWCCTPRLPGSDDVSYIPLNKTAESIVQFWFTGGRRDTPAGDLTNMQGYPNPATQNVVFGRVPGSVELSIYDLSGRHIRTVAKDDDGSSIRWDLRDDSGRRCPTGVYLCTLRSFQEYRKARVIVLK